MLEHLNQTPAFAERTVVVGAGGFVGGAIVRRLTAAGASVLEIARRDVDLSRADAGAMLAGHLRSTDALVCVSAIAPCKDLQMFKDNISLIEAFCDALQRQPVAHVVNIGSDAIYADSMEPLSETSCAEPGSVHGLMHLTREVMVREAAGATPFATLRPTLIYGADDPHNGYGPNRFRRLAAKGEKIVLFGEGEERRDHVWVEDVAELATRILGHRSKGALNAATGTVISFRDAADLVVAQFGDNIPISGSPRSGAMPHNGYRPFDPAATLAAFPDFAYAQPADGIAKVHAQALSKA